MTHKKFWLLSGEIFVADTTLRRMFYPTGIYSGSSLSDRAMGDGEFKYHKVYDGSVTPIKTHRRGDHRLGEKVDYDKAIVLFRSPYECIRANYQRSIAGKTGVITPEVFDEKRKILVFI